MVKLRLLLSAGITAAGVDAVTVNVDKPTRFGLPLMMPFLLNFRPGGSAPRVTANRALGLAKPNCYGRPRTAAYGLGCGGLRAGLMVTTKVALVDPKKYVDSVTVNLNVPASVGVPVISSPSLRTSPGGSDPAVTANRSLRWVAKLAVNAVPCTPNAGGGGAGTPG